MGMVGEALKGALVGVLTFLFMLIFLALVFYLAYLGLSNIDWENAIMKGLFGG